MYLTKQAKKKSLLCVLNLLKFIKKKKEKNRKREAI